MAHVTHEQFIHAVMAAATAQLESDEDRATLEGVKLVYGAGINGVRGITYYQRWKAGGHDEVRPFVEIGAFTQRDWVQVAGTTIHELAHVVAGWEAAHGPNWKAACERLGLRRAKAAGTNYCLAHFAPALRDAIARMPKPDEGEPVCGLDQQIQYIGKRKGTLNVKGCAAGVGTKGGKSRGAGSGSRLRLWECEGLGDEHKPVKVRVASDDFRATCDCCNTAFRLIK